MWNDRILEVNVAILRKKFHGMNFDKKKTKNGMNEKPENWQCEVPIWGLKLDFYSRVHKRIEKLVCM